MYTTENKPAKRFDYNAYIQGRLAGKYVIAYIDEDITEKSLTEHINDSIEPFADISYDVIVSKEEKGKLAITIIVNGNRAQNSKLNTINKAGLITNCDRTHLHSKPFHHVPDINCRGAPLCRFSEALKF